METTVFFDQVGKAIGKAGDVIAIKLENPRLWSPDHPFLYKMQVRSPNPVESTNTAIVLGNCWEFCSGWTQLWRRGPLLCWSPDHSTGRHGRRQEDHTSQWETSGFPGCNHPQKFFHYPSTCSNMNSWSQFLFLYPLKDIFFWPDSFL